MLLDKLFGNTFGMIWLIIFMVAILALFCWLLFFNKDNKEKNIIDNKNEKEIENIKEIEGNSNEEIEGNVLVEEQEVESKKSIFGNYEIIERKDGFFRVRKNGSDKILRKLSSREEAIQYIKERSVK